MKLAFFVGLALPSNNFGALGPGTNAQIKPFCVSRQGTRFDLSSRFSVKEKEQHPLSADLTTFKAFEGDTRWNFNKFLVNPSGVVVARYPSGVEPTSAGLTAKLESILPKMQTPTRLVRAPLRLVPDSHETPRGASRGSC